MALAQSKVTSQGQISVPADVRQKLGLEPGSIIEWIEDDGGIRVRKVGTYDSKDVNNALFGNKQPRKGRPVAVKDGIRKYIRQKFSTG